MPLSPPILRSPAGPPTLVGGGGSRGGSAAQRVALHPARDDAAPPPTGEKSPPGSAPLGRPRLDTNPDHRRIPGDPDAQARAVWLTLIVGVALALRAGVFVLGPLANPTRAVWPDPAAGPIYAMVLGLFHQLGVPTFMWLALQCVASALTPLVIFALALALLQRTGPALVAAAILAVHPAAIVAANSLTHEVWFTLLLAVGLYTALGLGPRRADAAGLGGIVMGLCWLLRPITLALTPLVALWVLLHRRKAHTALAVTMFLAGSALAPLGWHAWARHRPGAAPAGLVSSVHGNWSHDSVLASRLMLRPSVGRLYHQFGIAHRGITPAEAFANGSADLHGPIDPPTAWLAGGWVGLNALALLGSLVAMPVLAWRRRYLLLLLLGGIGVSLTLTTLPDTSEGLRLPWVVIQAILIASLAVPADPRPLRQIRSARVKRQRRRDPFNLAAVEADHTAPISTPEGRPI